MDRPSRLAGRRAGIVLTVLTLVVGLTFAGVVLGSMAGEGMNHAGVAATSARPVEATTTAIHPSAAPVQPAQGGVTTASVQLVTSLSTYTTLPTNLVVNLTITDSNFSAATTGLWLNISDYVTGALCDSTNISSMVTPLAPVVTNNTTGASFSTQYLTFPLTTAYFANYTTTCPNLAIDSSYLNITMFENGGPNGTASAYGVSFGVYSPLFPPGWGVQPVTSFVFAPPTSQLNFAPTAGQPGTYTLSANYTGQYVGKVQLVISSPSGIGVVLSANLRWNGTTPTVVSWTEATPASYPYTLTVYTTYGSYPSAGVLSLSPSSLVYYNSSTWTNATVVPGLSAGAAGTLLLVLGMIVGILVALVVGRLVWGGPSSPGAPQPWTPQQGAATTNQCTVCNQTFATPEELAAHQKSEHGMQ
jgi:hypothetical protein